MNQLIYKVDMYLVTLFNHNRATWMQRRSASMPALPGTYLEVAEVTQRDLL
ncbi:hypothetical protein [Telluribacter humicola]|uniref:hypothetical protein n=1 Tax=Telluribacter humicola TaxID=1720261 RepID=UPI001A965E37|nr:hypothetical protein [Telluribacter humicola]